MVQAIGWCGVLALLLSAEPRLLAGEGAYVSSQSTERDLADRFACGRNCLYILLRLYGVSCDFFRVCSTVPVGRDGTSMLDLRKAASQFGLDSLVVRCGYDDLTKLRCPVIACIDTEGPPVTGIGHYVVVLASDCQEVDYIDGTSASRQQIRAELFQHMFSGVILFSEGRLDSRNGVRRLHGFALASVVVVMAFMAWFRLRRRYVHFLAAAFVLASFLSVPGVSTAALSPEKDGIIWRTSENDGVNALYLLLRIQKIQATYNEVAQACPKGRMDLRQLRDVARHFGLMVDVFHCRTAHHLRGLYPPFLVHMDTVGSSAPDEHSSSRSGSIALVVRISKESYYLLDCGHLMLREVSEESFRRDWSGYALGMSLGEEARIGMHKFWISLLAGGLAFAVYCGWRHLRIGADTNDHVQPHAHR